jgi:hypothetical protein
MASDSVSEDADEQKVRANWVKCLGEAQTRRRDEAHPPPFLTAPEVRSVAEHIGCQIARRYGVESPQVVAAVATLISMSHPTVLALLLAGAPTVVETAQGRQ